MERRFGATRASEKTRLARQRQNWGRIIRPFYFEVGKDPLFSLERAGKAMA